MQNEAWRPFDDIDAIEGIEGMRSARLKGREWNGDGPRNPSPPMFI